MHLHRECGALHETATVTVASIPPSVVVIGYHTHLHCDSGPCMRQICYGYRVYFISYGSWLPDQCIFNVLVGPCMRHIL